MRERHAPAIAILKVKTDISKEILRLGVQLNDYFRNILYFTLS